MAETRLDLSSTTRSKFFQSPQTPSSTLKSRPTIATSHIEQSYFSANHRPSTLNRKRSRNDSSDVESPCTSAVSPPPLTNTHYRLAGGLDTPTAISSQYSDHDTTTPDVTFRRGRPYTSHERTDYFHELGSSNDISGIPGKDGNGRAPKPINQSSSSQSSWGSLVFGLAGKIINFCTAGSFQGFFSGGGQGYPTKLIHDVLPARSPQHQIGDYEWLDIPTSLSHDLDTEESRVCKRSKVVHDNTWVMVPTPSRSPHKIKPSFIPRPSSPATFRNGSPIRQSTNASTVTIGRALKRPIGNLQHTTSSRIASSAGLRSANTVMELSATRAGHIHCRDNSVKVTSHSINRNQDSRAVNPTSSKSSTKTQTSISSGSPSPHFGVQTREQTESPLAKETRIHLDGVRKSELAEDIEIMRMNRHLKNLINQGKEALGTRVEVDFGENDEDHW